MLKQTQYFLQNKITRKEEIAKNISLLREVILYHSHKYYQEDDPSITDSEFDILFGILKTWEEKFPEYKTPDSPTQKISVTLQSRFEKTKHLVPMISLDNAFTHTELEEWEARWKKIAEKEEIDITEYESPLYIVEPKFDGLGISVVYENGMISRAVTRGDGEEGETVTQNIKTIKEIPNTIKNISGVFEIRGEVVMKKSEFNSLNTRLEKQEKKIFSNPRNAAAGSLRQLDSRITQDRKLSVFFYETPLNETQEILKNYHATLQDFEQKNIPHCPQYFECNSLDEVKESIERISSLRENFDFEIDGVVIKINHYALREKIGATGHHPRWAIAWKFPAMQVTTTLENVEWQIGRTGVLTPVAHLTPVTIDGVVVSRATLHNMDNIIEKDLRIGDRVVLIRSGEVIPKILRAEKTVRTGEEKIIIAPGHCPICDFETEKTEEEVALKCSNPLCPKILVGALRHFASKKAMNITGLGKEVAEEIIEKKLIQNFSDLYRLSQEDFCKIENFKEKSAQNLFLAIQKSKSQPLWRIINAFGIHLIGEKSAKSLAKNFPSLQKISQASMEDIADIYDMGEKSAEKVVEFFRNQEEMIMSFQEIFIFLENSEHRDTAPKKTVETIFSNKTVVLTGKLENFSRDEVSEIIEQLGGKISGSLSKNTDFLLCGEKAGSKKTKAQELGVTIVTEEEFLEQINTASTNNYDKNNNERGKQSLLF